MTTPALGWDYIDYIEYETFGMDREVEDVCTQNIENRGRGGVFHYTDHRSTVFLSLGYVPWLGGKNCL
jgi:hypothetical protein